MNKLEAIKDFINRDLNAVPQEWVKIVAENEGNYPRLPMWGTMWIVEEDFIGKKLIKHSRIMAESAEEIELDAIENEKDREAVQKAIANDQQDWSLLEQYIDEEMAGEHCVLDKDGNTTALFVYEVGDEYVIGVNGAGWNFYDGVWDKLYDLLGLKWHEEM